ncbi:MAG: hypothetical protein HYV63_07205 [Candidatus Schekmanbacteria bacterium]|nr:hypothetical protein [Candidatus Schekmanbacteria bacterium]
MLAPRMRIPGYRIVALVGEGGMGRVFRAVQGATGRTVALKVVRLPQAEHAFASGDTAALFRGEPLALLSPEIRAWLRDHGHLPATPERASC